MKCPRCGTHFADSAMYCPKCGEEIKIVPEFDPEIENRIDESLSGLADNIDKSSRADYRDDSDYDDADDFDANVEGHIFGNSKATIVVLCIVLVALLIGVVYYLSSHKGTDNTGYTPRKGGSAQVSSDLDPAGDSVGKGTKADAQTPETPAFSIPEGTYDTAQEIYITAGKGTVYYTINGSIPMSTDPIYNGIDPIKLEENGTYVLRAVLVSSDGVSSEVATAKYEITMQGPAAPTVMEDSGNYMVDTQIAVIAAEGTTVYYTTDDADPDETATMYVDPIEMPYGESRFRFVAVDDETGAVSEIVEREYSLHYAVVVSEEQAGSYLITQLVTRGYLLDGAGRVPGLDGFNSYSVAQIMTFDNGDYYLLKEYHTTAAGAVWETGVIYAVNVHTGDVYKAAKNSMGLYVLENL